MMPSQPRRPVAGLHEALRDKLLALVGIPSPSRSEQAIAAFLASTFAALPGVRVTRTGDNLIATIEPAPAGRPRLLLCGHLDTVPPQNNLVARVDGDHVFGLGASDLKAGLAVFWQLLESLPPERLRYDPVLVLYAREEIAFRESGLIEIEAAHPWLRAAELAICVEPTANFVELGCLGTLHAQVTVRGESAHSARPWLGKNAIHLALPIAERVARYPERRVCSAAYPGIEYREVMNVTRIEGGRARNMIPDRVQLNVNFRFGPDRTGEDACRLIQELVGGDAEVLFADLAPPGRVPCGNRACDALIELTGGRKRAKQAWTDVGRFSQWGLDAVSFGPGLPELAHRQDEHASIAAMVESHGIFARLLWGEEP
ncbi:MAG: succinyl-diaminopimelate desuccinylase [Planctomycetota bacterium]